MIITTGGDMEHTDEHEQTPLIRLDPEDEEGGLGAGGAGCLCHNVRKYYYYYYVM